MAGRSALLVNAAELLRDPGTRKHISDVVPPADIDVASAAITGDIAVEVDLESTVDDIGLPGTIGVPWTGHCRRCLKPLTETLTSTSRSATPTNPDQTSLVDWTGRSPSSGARSTCARWCARRSCWRSTRRACAATTALDCVRCAART